MTDRNGYEDQKKRGASRALRISGLLVLSTPVAVALSPPEAFGSGRMLLVVLSTFAFLLLAVEGTIPRRYLSGGAVAMAALLAHSIWLSVDPYRSIEFLGLAWAYYCLFGACRYARNDLARPAAVVLVLTASAVAFHAIYQYLWGFGNLAEIIEASTASDTFRSGVLGHLSSQRVFATFALPGTLWGFLILTIPLHAAVWSDAGRRVRALLTVNLALILAASALTQSYGFVLGLLVAGGAWALTSPGRPSLPKAAIAISIAAPVAGGLAAALYLARVATHNPLWLRLQNWASGWDMLLAYPWGAGLNTYGVLYPQFQQPGANETQFAHNTPIQLVAEMGLAGLLFVGLLGLALVRKAGRAGMPAGIERYLLAALAVWGVHNLMDINVYFGSVGAVGVLLAALYLWSPPADDEKEPAPHGARLPALAATGMLAVLFIVSSGVMYVSGELLHSARIDIGFSRARDAAATLDLAARINPFDSSVLHEAGQTELELYHGARDREHLLASQDYFSRAVRLSPLKVGPRIGLALSLSSEDRVDEALEQLRIAEELHPAGTQAPNIRRLVENRAAELNAGAPEGK
jgi:hypothetical protein